MAISSPLDPSQQSNPQAGASNPEWFRNRVQQFPTAVAAALRGRPLARDLSFSTRGRLLRGLSAIPIKLERHADAQPSLPRRIFKRQFLEPLGLTVTATARVLGVSRKQFSQSLNERAGISPDMVLRLARAFSTTPELWMTSQGNHDLWTARQKFSAKVDQTAPHPLRPLADLQMERRRVRPRRATGVGADFLSESGKLIVPGRRARHCASGLLRADARWRWGRRSRRRDRR